MNRSTFILSFFALFLVLLSPCVKAEIPEGTVEVLGEEEGALYALYLPPSWNNDLVLYAHGYTYIDRPLELPNGRVGEIRCVRCCAKWRRFTVNRQSHGIPRSAVGGACGRVDRSDGGRSRPGIG